jgi:hypothetical protein
MHVSVAKNEKNHYDLGPKGTKDARSRHHVEEVMARILAKRTNSKTITLGRTDQEDADTDDHWHCFRN